MYYENKYLVERNLKIKLNILLILIEYIDIVFKFYIFFCFGNLKKKLNLWLYNGVVFNILLFYILIKYSFEWICMYV